VVPGRQGNGNNRNPMLPGRHLPGESSRLIKKYLTIYKTKFNIRNQLLIIYKFQVVNYRISPYSLQISLKIHLIQNHIAQKS
jgi:hypothetical protein